jgi:hypothetical protein
VSEDLGLVYVLAEDGVPQAVGGDDQDVIGRAADREVADLGAAGAGGVEG